MPFIEVHLLNGNIITVRKDLILWVMKMTTVSKETLKSKPFLKTSLPCTLIQLSVPQGELFCSDAYEVVMQKLSEK